MARRPPQTTIDYMVVALSPVLIMCLIGSLSFFLIQVAYAGEFPGRFRIVCALFVMAAVLCCRLAIEEGAAYAQLFGIPLAIATLMAMMRFVDASVFIDVFLIAVVWWSAYKLTWDCTVVDDKVTASGNGLLETVGLDPIATDAKPEVNAPKSPREDLPAAASRADDSSQDVGFWQRWSRPAQRNHSSGVWVVYFAMASLPLFGLGQILLAEPQRAEGFRLLVIYVASALGLLMTTSLLQLRRYLRQRQIQMPDSMAGTWLGMGGVMALAVLMICMFLPLPTPDYSLTGLFRKVLSPENLKASNWGFGREGVEDEKLEGGTSKQAQRESDQTGSESQSDQTGDGEGRKQQSGEQESDAKQQTGDQSKSSQDNRKRSDDDSSNRSSDRSQSDSDSQADSQRQDSSGEKSQGDKSNDTQANDSQANDSQANDSSDDRGSSEQRSSEERTQNSRSDSPSSDRNPSSRSEPPSPAKNPLAALSSLGSILRFLYWMAFLGLAAYFAWKYRKQISLAVSQFIQSIRDFLNRLFGGGQEAAAEETEELAEVGPPPPPFAAYQNPFVSGAANSWPLNQLVRYSFEALEAWAREHGCARRPDQTPVEFAALVGQKTEPLAKPAAGLAKLYNRIAYARDQPASASNMETVRQLWGTMA